MGVFMMGTPDKCGYERYLVKTFRFLSPWNDDHVQDFEWQTESLEEAMQAAHQQAELHKGDKDKYVVCIHAYVADERCGYVHVDGQRKKEIQNWVEVL